VLSLHLASLAYAHRPAVPLFADLELRLGPGWCGVVGPNGCGKTTLLRLVAGELTPDAGRVAVSPHGACIVYCPQEIDVPDAGVLALAAATDGVARRLHGALGLDPAELVRWPTLSPGERKRWQIAAALASEPAVLLLDEPTNHLAGDARMQLVAALRTHDGIGLLVSHDRALLNALCDATLRFRQDAVRWYRGAYDVARETWEREEREGRDAWDRARAEERPLERRLRERQMQKAQSMAALRTSKHLHGRHPNDKVARSAFKATRRRSKDVSLGREVKKLHHRLERHAQLRPEAPRDDLGRTMFVDWVPAPRPMLLSLDVAVLRAGERPVLRDVCVAVTRDARIRVAGPNGAGKTTLLRALVASASPATALLWLPQELSASEGRTLLDETRTLDRATRGRVLTIVAGLGVDPERLLASERPSPGETRKLVLALGLGRRVVGLVLDEPTNHLDLPAIERLEEMLAAYPGAIVLVTHDDAFAAHLTSRCWEIAGGRLREGASLSAR
jgi:ATPase subunit of ABC transporter with duplicated ATPase domains